MFSRLLIESLLPGGGYGRTSGKIVVDLIQELSLHPPDDVGILRQDILRFPGIVDQVLQSVVGMVQYITPDIYELIPVEYVFSHRRELLEEAGISILDDTFLVSRALITNGVFWKNSNADATARESHRLRDSPRFDGLETGDDSIHDEKQKYSQGHDCEVYELADPPLGVPEDVGVDVETEPEAGNDREEERVEEGESPAGEGRMERA